MTDRVGQQLGNYHLIRLLGHGGFAVVYLGEHIHLNTLAAIKVLDTRLTSDEIAQFRNEARTIARLEHPHIVRILDFGVEESIPFLVMGYAPNGTLRQHYQRGTCLSPEKVLPYVKQVASALQYAHDQKLIHRDVKPENMLLGRNNEILLSDFGLAMVTYNSSQESPRDSSGTIAYMAPEQARGNPRPASDQYALAVSVYEWLCGTRPFNGSYEEVAIQHVLNPPPPLCQVEPSIPPALEGVVLKALAKDPHQRFASIQDFADAFEQASQAGQTPVEIAQPAPSPTPARQVTNTPHQESAFSTDRSHAAMIYAVAWSPGGKHIASCSGTDKTIQVWDARSGESVLTYRDHMYWARAIAWSPDGMLIASGSWREVQVWNAAKGRKVTSYRGHEGWVRAVAWSPDGKRIASTSEDKMVQVWEIAKSRPLATYRGHTDWVGIVEWSPDGNRILSVSKDNIVQVWDAEHASAIASTKPHAQSNVPTFRAHADSVHAVVWLPDGKHIASASGYGSVQVWQAV